MQKEKQLVPKLRFSEFEGEWKMKKLGNLGNFIGGGTPDSSNEKFWNGNILWISSSDITEESIHLINKTRFITKDAVEKSATKIIPKGSVLMVSRVGIGKFAVSDENVCTSQDFTNLKTKENSYFTAYYFKARSRRFEKLSQGTSIKGFTTKDIKSAKFAFPSLPEQQKIADFLSAVDTRIHNLEKKKELLEQYKKGITQKIFKQEIRFKPAQSGAEGDDNGKAFPEWEKKKMRNFLSIPTKIHPDKIDPSKIMTVKLHLNGVHLNERTDGLKIGSTKYIKRKKGQFIYGKQNLFNGAFGIIPVEFDGFLSSGDVPSLDIDNSKIIAAFFYFYLSRKSFYRRLESLSSGSGSKRIHEKTLLKLDIELPSLEEQQKIANFLSAIDQRINLVTQQLTQTKTYKKGLLQQMFV
ncbi:MAG: restriction endonuclease subunit S [Mesonia sp.]|uniref:restriction endonuclease subunit S n=1 Tax=Mesonia sp. TaxID=1960830 RepID=UPI003F97A0E5